MRPQKPTNFILAILLTFSLIPGGWALAKENILNERKVKTNHLAGSNSPYLLQHATNPVDWYPWGEEPFARARKEDKPVFLSIGYSTCHWCHVMARECFENEEIAVILNRDFISIKVDREERPDLDRVYMAAVNAMTGGGGWPMSLFLTPDGRPFFAGTYFPPDDRYGRPGFKRILTRIAESWHSDRQRIDQAASRLHDHLDGLTHLAKKELTAKIADLAVAGFSTDFDPEYGGFGPGPKFPRPAGLEFLFSRYLAGAPGAGRMVKKTLSAMAAGGIYDYLGGGFHRYSVDRAWQVPHFEKMLYDQAQLANIYLRAGVVWPNQGFTETAAAVLDYVMADLGDRRGGFYSAEDADSPQPDKPDEHREGAFYLWRMAELVPLMAGDATLIRGAFCFSDEGNLPGEYAEFAGLNNVRRPDISDHLLAETALSRDDALLRLDLFRDKLARKRAARPRPHLDDKVILSWNGMTISALARAYIATGREQYLKAARRGVAFIDREMVDRKGKELYHSWRQGVRSVKGQNMDYAAWVSALLDLYQATFEPDFLMHAEAWASRQRELFFPKGRMRESLDLPQEMPEVTDLYDGAEPASISLSTMNFVRMADLGLGEKWRGLADELLDQYSGAMAERPTAMPILLNAYLKARDGAARVVVVGDENSDDCRAIFSALRPMQAMGRVAVISLTNEEARRFFTKKSGEFSAMADKDKAAMAYYCKGRECRPPVGTVSGLMVYFDPLPSGD